MRRKQKTLTEAEWDKVFRIRCKAKQGQYLSEDDTDLMTAAFESDRERYNALTNPVFDATKPFGSK